MINCVAIQGWLYNEKLLVNIYLFVSVLFCSRINWLLHQFTNLVPDDRSHLAWNRHLAQWQLLMRWLIGKSLVCDHPVDIRPSKFQIPSCVLWWLDRSERNSVIKLIVSPIKIKTNLSQLLLPLRGVHHTSQSLWNVPEGDVNALGLHNQVELVFLFPNPLHLVESKIHQAVYVSLETISSLRAPLQPQLEDVIVSSALNDLVTSIVADVVQLVSHEEIFGRHLVAADQKTLGIGKNYINNFKYYILKFCFIKIPQKQKICSSSLHTHIFQYFFFNVCSSAQTASSYF